ncbi:hypothetical protein [Halapricum desulfuricans]|uniref:Uncharacterized protein n=1 Tax=Halapricum desulfuricans TaxID=2841257 RepID=A0A897MWP3_9EURY|nr:hypothetical protein [Halapricum desulfuricans]QSG04398.1 hypothetical protein HSR121_0037 [Halapricum desulfuricans]
MVDPSQWAAIDDLWAAYIESDTEAVGSADVRSLHRDWGTELWHDLDSWWESSVHTLSATLSTGRTLHQIGGHTEWKDMGPWWDSYLDTLPATMNTSMVPKLVEIWGADTWEVVDPWWEKYVDTPSSGLTSSAVRKLDDSWGTGEWSEMDLWWEAYAVSQREQVSDLRDCMERLNDEWERSPSRFDRDPLTTDWTSERRSSGPLRITHEEDWSHWFAHLVRASSGAFTGRLFGDDFEIPPQEVRREVRFHNPDGPNRRIDILVDYESIGLSIEVKRNDTRYEKTPETAGLIDNQKNGEWTHLLLLPRHKSSRLRWHFGDRLVEPQDSATTIVSTDYPDVRVLYWETVSRILRETLLAGEEHDPHWESSAYLFVSHIEQHISSFESVSPDWDPSMAGEETAGTPSLTALQRLTTADLSEQLTHFKQTLETQQ